MQKTKEEIISSEDGGGKDRAGKLNISGDDYDREVERARLVSTSAGDREEELKVFIDDGPESRKENDDKDIKHMKLQNTRQMTSQSSKADTFN